MGSNDHPFNTYNTSPFSLTSPPYLTSSAMPSHPCCNKHSCACYLLCSCICISKVFLRCIQFSVSKQTVSSQFISYSVSSMCLAIALLLVPYCISYMCCLFLFSIVNLVYPIYILSQSLYLISYTISSFSSILSFLSHLTSSSSLCPSFLKTLIPSVLKNSF